MPGRRRFPNRRGHRGLRPEPKVAHWLLTCAERVSTLDAIEEPTTPPSTSGSSVTPATPAAWSGRQSAQAEVAEFGYGSGEARGTVLSRRPVPAAAKVDPRHPAVWGGDRQPVVRARPRRRRAPRRGRGHHRDRFRVRHPWPRSWVRHGDGLGRRADAVGGGGRPARTARRPRAEALPARRLPLVPAGRLAPLESSNSSGAALRRAAGGHDAARALDRVTGRRRRRVGTMTTSWVEVVRRPTRCLRCSQCSSKGTTPANPPGFCRGEKSVIASVSPLRTT